MENRIEFDENRNMIRLESSNEIHKWQYDEYQNTKFHSCTYNSGYWINEYFDSRGNIIYSKNANGFEEWRNYDENRNMIYSKDSDGEERYYGARECGHMVYTYENDEYGNMIKTTGVSLTPMDKKMRKYEKFNGNTLWYDEKGRVVYFQGKDGCLIEYKYYSEGGTQKVVTNSNGTLSTWNYDVSGRLIQYIDDIGAHEFEYDEANNTIRHIYRGFEELEYDDETVGFINDGCF